MGLSTEAGGLLLAEAFLAACKPGRGRQHGWVRGLTGAENFF